MENQKQQQILSFLCHLSVFCGSFLPIISICLPIGIFILSDDLVVKKNAKEAINYHITNSLGWTILIIVFIIAWLVGASVIFPFTSLGIEGVEKISLTNSGIWFYVIIGVGCLLTLVVTITAFWMVTLFIMSWIVPLIAVVTLLNNSGKHYRYPFIIRFLK